MLAIQEYAMDLLLEAHQTQLPIDEMAIAQYLGCEVYPYSQAKELLVELKHWDYAQRTTGLSFRFDGVTYICYSDKLSLIERRSVIMHEVGHIYLKHLSHGGILGKSASKIQEDTQEREADAFALYALAPVHILMRCGITSQIEIQRMCRLSEADAKTAASRIAALRRPKAAKLLFPALFLIIGVFTISSVIFSSQPSEAVRPPASATVYITRNGSCYHRKDCYQIADSEIVALSREEAEDNGYTPCKTCHPES